MTNERPGKSGINVDLEDILPANTHLTMEEFLEIAENVDSLFELSRETRLSRERCRRVLKYFERHDEVKQGFGFFRDTQDDDRIP
jgi:response regulator of citrate/malate metabolism